MKPEGLHMKKVHIDKVQAAVNCHRLSSSHRYVCPRDARVGKHCKKHTKTRIRSIRCTLVFILDVIWDTLLTDFTICGPFTTLGGAEQTAHACLV
jgi:hypothetical protein